MEISLQHAILVLLLVTLFSAIFVAPIAGDTNSVGWVFQKTWGGKGDDLGNGVVVDTAGNIYITGSTNSFSNGSQLFLLKFDATGNLLWQKLWNGSTGGESIKIDSSANIFLAGIDKGAFLLKINGTGDIIWQEKWGNGSFVNEGLALGPSGDIYLTGTLFYNYTYSHLLLAKFDSSGTPIWQKTWGGNCTTDGMGVVVNANGEAYVTGYTDSFSSYYPNGMRYCDYGYGYGGFSYTGVLLKFNSTGGLEWQRIGGSPGTQGIAIDYAGNVYVTGTAICGDFFGTDATFAKFNPSGYLLWEGGWDLIPSQLYSPHQISCPVDSIFSLATDYSGNIYASGMDGIGTLLVNLDTNGNLLSAYSWGKGEGKGIALDYSETPVLTGYIEGPPYTYNLVEGPGSCYCRVSSIVSPSGVSGNITFPITNLNGSTTDVQGSSTYSGGRDVLLNYGSRFSVLTFNPVIGALLIGTAIVAVRIALTGRGKQRILGLQRSSSGYLDCIREECHVTLCSSN